MEDVACRASGGGLDVPRYTAYEVAPGAEDQFKLVEIETPVASLAGDTSVGGEEKAGVSRYTLPVYATPLTRI